MIEMMRLPVYTFCEVSLLLHLLHSCKLQMYMFVGPKAIEVDFGNLFGTLYCCK